MNNLALQEQFDAQIASSKRASQSLLKQLNAKEDAEAKERADDVKIASMVLLAMSKIPKPKDGKSGKNGTNGYDGVDGSNGTDGIRGAVGKTGVIGPVGKTGLKGDKGDAGLDGTLGAKGTTGEQGTQGITGEAGKDGLDGRDGTNGTNGIDGKAGATGECGEAGRDGIDGTSLVNIKSTPLDYVFTLSNGNEINMPMPSPLRGDSGKTGDVGAKGREGKSGKDGLKGKEGTRGKKGADGDTGVGIEDIVAEDGNLSIKLTDGKTKTVKLPSRGPGGAPVAPMDFQRAARVPYDNTASGLGATNVQEALDLVAAGGSAFPEGTVANFMTTFNSINDTHSARFVYNAGNQLISTSVVNESDDVLYLIDFTYETGVERPKLINKLITDMNINDSVETVFEYTSGLLTRKLLTYSV